MRAETDSRTSPKFPFTEAPHLGGDGAADASRHDAASGAQEAGLAPSMGLIGDCYDNAVIESFWGRMQTELLNRKKWK